MHCPLHRHARQNDDEVNGKVCVDVRLRCRQMKAAALTAGGLLIGCTLRTRHGAAQRAVTLNAWVRIAPDNIVTVVVSQSEMGQGITTTLPAVLVEELGADWSRVKLENAPHGSGLSQPAVNWQFTGNSESVTGFFDLMRDMGASARDPLIRAAAARWMSGPTMCLLRPDRGGRR
jgi:isoquinoline 1-oxidoreductase subunit beta